MVAGLAGRALAFSAGLGMTVERVLTDNGAGYRSRCSVRSWPLLGWSTSAPPVPAGHQRQG